MHVRQEPPADYADVSALIQAAYIQVSYRDKKEQLMVDRLRKSDAFIPQLSLVAQTDTGDLLGHILLTKLHIQHQHQPTFSGFR